MRNDLHLSGTEPQLGVVEEIAHLGTWEWDPAADRVSWSAGLSRLAGLDPAPGVASYAGFLALLQAAQGARLDAAMREAARTRKPFAAEHRAVFVDGEPRTLLVGGRAAEGPQGVPARVVGVVQDIGERGRLREERDRFFELSLDLLCVAGMDGFFRRVNPAFERVLGYSSEELLSTPFLELVHEEDRAASLAELARLAGGQQTVGFENRIRCRDGSYRVLQWSAASLPASEELYAVGRDVTRQRDAEAEHARLLQEQAAREAAETGERRARFLAEASRVLASSLDYEATLRSVADLAVAGLADWCAVDLVAPDGSARRVTVAHPDPAKARLVFELHRRYPLPPDAPVGTPHVLRTRQADLRPRLTDDVLERVAHDAEHLRILRELGLRSYMAVPLVAREQVLGVLLFASAESGREFGADDLALAQDLALRAATAIDNARLHQEVCEARDLLEEQASELEMQAEELQAQAAEMEVNQAELEAMTEELQQANESLQTITAAAEEARARAEEANAAKSAFLANMSHELRTPLNAIAGYTELLELGIHGPVTAEQRSCLVKIHRNQTHLLGLINDILNFARLEAGQVRYEIRDVPVDELLAGMKAMIEPQIGAKRLRYTYRPGDRRVTVRADRERVQQIVLNLLTNATKFTPPGGRVELEWEDRAPAVVIRVRDTGPGIPADKMERIFEPFVQVERTYRAEGEGVGLGLAISRDLARGLGGDLAVQSEEGNGSTFILTLRQGVPLA